MLFAVGYIAGRAFFLWFPRPALPSWQLHFRDHATCRGNCRWFRPSLTGLITTPTLSHPPGSKFLVSEKVRVVVVLALRSGLLREALWFGVWGPDE